MATYVMSDIHGEGRRFHAMLRRLRLTAEDTLYILGDVIDRGTDGVALLRFIMGEENIVLLKGNHEQLCLDYYREGASFLETLRWGRNGNAHTLRAMDRMREKPRRELLSYLEQLPDFAEVTVGEKCYYLVHGMASENAYERLWSRPDFYMPPPLPGKTLVVGHTPGVVYSKHEPVRDHFRILFAPGFIDIDCGCGHSSEQRRLACLRLDDMEEFYC